MLFARAPVGGHFVADVLPSMILLGFGAGIAFNPMLLAAMGDVDPQRLRPGLRDRQHLVHDGRRARAGRPGQPRRVAHASLLGAGHGRLFALAGGYHVSFLVAAAFAVLAAALGGLGLRSRSSEAATTPRCEPVYVQA